MDDEPIKEALYNLGLDFERKRQFNKAVSVYEHIYQAGEFKDIGDRIKKLKSVGETVIFGPTGGRKDATVLIQGAETKPTLGRYEILKELGRGAMGTVYLGKDPKINRDVAIKTLRACASRAMRASEPGSGSDWANMKSRTSCLPKLRGR